MDYLGDDANETSGTRLFDRAVKQQWPAMEAAIVARMGRMAADQDSAGQAPPGRTLVAATKCLLAADKLGRVGQEIARMASE